MAMIDQIPPEKAEGRLKELYDSAEKSLGYVPNYLKLFSHRPDVYDAWQTLIGTIRKHMRLRRYELVTIAAARTLDCTYCMLAHGSILLNNQELDADQLAALATDIHLAGLTDEEIAVMKFAEKIMTKASSVTQADVDRLKSFGLTDEEILDITLAAAARSFFSKTLDTLDAQPDEKYLTLDPQLRSALVGGRPFASPTDP